MMAAPMDEYEKRYMDPGEEVLFREKVTSRGAFIVAIVFLVVFGAVGLALIGAGAAGAVPPGVGLGAGSLAALFAAFMGIAGVMFSVFRAMVTGSNVHVHFGWAKRKIRLSAIESIHAMRLKGFKQGKVSVGLDGVVRTWVGNSPSGRGVEITYREESGRKHVLTIGSDDADRFVETVERARAGTPTTDATPVRVATEGAEEEHASAEPFAGLDEGESPGGGPRQRARQRRARVKSRGVRRRPRVRTRRPWART